MHPEHQRRLGGAVAATAAPTADALVRGTRDGADALGLFPRAEDDRVQAGHRAREPTPRILPETVVVDDARRDKRVRSLHEQRAGAAEHQHRLAGDAPYRSVRFEVTRTPW